MARLCSPDVDVRSCSRSPVPSEGRGGADSKHGCTRTSSAFAGAREPCVPGARGRGAGAHLGQRLLRSASSTPGSLARIRPHDRALSRSLRPVALNPAPFGRSTAGFWQLATRLRARAPRRAFQMLGRMRIARGGLLLLRVCFRLLWRIVSRSLRVVALIMIAASPNAPPPPLPRPAPIEVQAENREDDDEDP